MSLAERVARLEAETHIASNGFIDAHMIGELQLRAWALACMADAIGGDDANSVSKRATSLAHTLKVLQMTD